MEYIPPKPLDLTVGRNRLPVPARPSLPHNAGLIALDVEGDLWEGLPVCSSLAQSIHPDGRFTHYGLTTLTYPSRYETEWELNLPTELQAVQMYFADGGCQATLGQAGSHAQILINLMGGVAACDRLRDPAVFHVLRTLTVRTVTKLAQNVTNLLQGRIASLSQAERDAVGDLIRTSFAEADVVPVLGRTPSTLRQLREDAELRQFYQQIPDILNDLIARRIVFRGCQLRPSSGGDSVGDFDIVYVRKRSVYAGECKAGSRLGEKDISLARLARDVGCAGFHFAALNDFDAQSLTMIESLRQEIAGVHANFEVFVHGRHDLLATP